MKKLLSIAAIFAVMSMSTHAADVEGGIFKNKSIEVIPEFFINNPPPQEPFLPNEEPYTPELNASEEHKDISDIAPEPSAAATGISYFEIRRVGSSNIGWEEITGPQTSTVSDHGGAKLYIGVVQRGYGNINNATMSGTSKAPFQSIALCGADLHSCTTGETITGWLYYFDFSGKSSGVVNVSSNSTAAPFGYWSDSLYIQ